MSLVVVDTDVASTPLRRRTSGALGRQLAGHTVATTFVTYGELCATGCAGLEKLEELAGCSMRSAETIMEGSSALGPQRRQV